MEKALFDSWTEKYDSWFTTPVGQYVRKYESELLLDILNPQPGELILDAGCGTGIFTRDVLGREARVMGMDLSLPMVARGVQQMHGLAFWGTCGDMGALPFGDQSFDRVFSMTAIEFVGDAALVISELERVVKIGGCIVVTTLNSLSPWAEQRRQKAERGHSLFQDITFRSPADMRQLIPGDVLIKTAIHFQKHDPVEQIPQIEEQGGVRQLETGAFLAARWVKN